MDLSFPLSILSTRKGCFRSPLLPLLVFLLSGALPLRAEEGVFSPPEPLTVPEIIYPSGFSEPVTGEVSLRFLVTTEGRVTEVTILRANDPAFIPPVLTALEEGIFLPARRYGVPISAYVETTLLIPPPPPPPPFGILRGKVFKRGSRDPVEGAEVRSERGGEVTTTGPDGGFTLKLPPGPVTIVVSAPGYEIYRGVEEIVPDQELTVVYRLTPTSINTLEVVIEGERPRQEISRITLKTREIRAVPGTFDDVLRVAQKLPGVATPNELSGQLLIRGSDNRDNRVYVDDIPLLLLYHFGALKSVIASELIQDVSLYPSNFSVHYGDAIGGILEVRLRDPSPEGLRGRAMVSTILSEGVVEGPIAENTGFILSARRSYLELFFRQLFPEESAGLSPVVVPWFYDYQGRIAHTRGPFVLRATFLGSKDRFEFVIPPERNLTPEFISGLDLVSEEHTQSLRSTYALPGITHETTLGLRESRQRFQIRADQYFELNTLRGVFRHETRWTIASGLEVVSGVDLQLLYPNATFSIPRPPRPGEFDYDPFTAPLLEERVRYRVDREGIYTALRLAPAPFRFELGLRGDRDGRSGISVADPRLNGEVDLDPFGVLRLGAGIYHQFAQLQENAPIIGEKDVGPNRGLHLLAGWERELPYGLKGRVEGFYKVFDRLIVQNRDPLSPVRYSNRGKGRAYGVEFTLLKPLVGNLFGWLNYSYVRSFRTDLTGKETPFRFDQPHILNLILSYYPSVHWEFGGALRYTTGNPLPTIVDHFYYGDLGSYLPIQENLGERFPPYFRLDLRAKYIFLFPAWNLAVLLEVLNATMHTNPLGVTYNRDYTRRSFVQSFPILPYLGVEASF